MIWAFWLAGIFFVLQLVLLMYLLLSKSMELRFQHRLDSLYKEKLPEFTAYFSGASTTPPRLPTEKRLYQELLQQVLSGVTSVTQDSTEQEQARVYAEEKLQPVYERKLQRGTWADRMNALFYIEDFRMNAMAAQVEAHSKQLSQEEEEYHQALRTLAVLDSDRLIPMLTELRQVNIPFVKEVYRRMSMEKLRDLSLQLEKQHPQHDLLRQALYVHAGEISWTDLLPEVEAALEEEDKEVRLKAMRALLSFQYVSSPEKVRAFFQSPHWEERMYACKVASALNQESWRQDLMRCLGDQVWWVRSAAAETIRSFSDGDIMLEYARTSHEDKFARDMAEQLLSMEKEV
ncbi:HEAT repeat domain-containing protein [Alkalicoccus chagannorensis]|uniref:HEAT repeat domain-containing protein n=1 Tax=Alkalicoccus chagannorensis TaxID=427072 RepID=UPI00040DED76|nr:HEAT repeat domain-containing protein [Alkalicoccus chagannorensis]